MAKAAERVRAALTAIGLGLPAKRITVNLAPADMPKEGTHYDLPIALGVMAAAGAIAPEPLKDFVIIGELGLDGIAWPDCRGSSRRTRRRRAWQRVDLPGSMRSRSGVGLG